MIPAPGAFTAGCLTGTCHHSLCSMLESTITIIIKCEGVEHPPAVKTTDGLRNLDIQEVVSALHPRGHLGQQTSFVATNMAFFLNQKKRFELFFELSLQTQHVTGHMSLITDSCDWPAVTSSQFSDS